MIPTPIINPTTFPTVRFANISVMLGIILPMAYIIGAFVFGGTLILSAYNIIIAQGDPERMQKARSSATFAVIGIAVLIMSVLLVKILGFVTNIDFPFL